MPETFTYQPQPMRVIFGNGTLAQLPDELERLSIKRALVLTTESQGRFGQELLGRLGGRGAGVFAGAVMHTPVEVTAEALQRAVALKADGVVAVGGGSTTGLGKAIALHTDLPQVVVPTNYAGSEMTPVLGQTRNGVKTTQSSPKILPETVIYDVDLTLRLPPGLTAVSGLNAMAHAAEALYAGDRNPVTSLMAEEALRVLATALPALVAQPADRDARWQALYGAWLCGACLGAVGMALHHKLCHVLGGAFDLPHAETHAIVLPHALAYNAKAAPEAAAKIARALDTQLPAQGFYDLGGRLGIKRALRDVGMPESGIERAVELALENPYWNPRPLERSALTELVARAWVGDPPAA